MKHAVHYQPVIIDIKYKQGIGSIDNKIADRFEKIKCHVCFFIHFGNPLTIEARQRQISLISITYTAPSYEKTKMIFLQPLPQMYFPTSGNASILSRFE